MLYSILSAETALTSASTMPSSPRDSRESDDFRCALCQPWIQRPVSVVLAGVLKRKTFDEVFLLDQDQISAPWQYCALAAERDALDASNHALQIGAGGKCAMLWTYSTSL